MTPTRREPITLRGISSRAWEHPADRGALVALRELRGFDVILRKLSSLFSEPRYRLAFLGSTIKVDRHQYSRVHHAFLDVCGVLDPEEVPELFVGRNPDLRGMTLGIDKPFIVISSGSLQMLDEEELHFLLGHELGHAMSGHALYHTLLIWLTNLTKGLVGVPVGPFALSVIVAALKEWFRKSELSADRAGLLSVQNPAVGTRVMAKLAGGGDLSDIDVAAFLDQAREYETGGDLRDSLLKIQLLLDRDHDFAVARAAALHNWVNDGDYQQILSGAYLRREDDADASLTEEAAAAAKSYREAFANSDDPLMRTLRKLRGRIDPREQRR